MLDNSNHIATSVILVFLQLTEFAKLSVVCHTAEIIWCNIIGRICAKNNILFKEICHMMISHGTFVWDPC